MHAELRELQVRRCVRSIFLQRQREKVPERREQPGQEEAEAGVGVGEGEGPQTPVLVQLRAPVRQVDVSLLEAAEVEVEAEAVRESRSVPNSLTKSC